MIQYVYKINDRYMTDRKGYAKDITKARLWRYIPPGSTSGLNNDSEWMGKGKFVKIETQEEELKCE